MQQRPAADATPPTWRLLRGGMHGGRSIWCSRRAHATRQGRCTNQAHARSGRRAASSPAPLSSHSPVPHARGRARPPNHAYRPRHPASAGRRHARPKRGLPCQPESVQAPCRLRKRSNSSLAAPQRLNCPKGHLAPCSWPRPAMDTPESLTDVPPLICSAGETFAHWSGDGHASAVQRGRGQVGHTKQNAPRREATHCRWQ